MDDNKVAVLLEDILAKFRAFGEGLDGIKDELRQFREETNNRFDKMELQNRQEHMQLMQMIKELDTKSRLN